MGAKPAATGGTQWVPIQFRGLSSLGELHWLAEKLTASKWITKKSALEAAFCAHFFLRVRLKNRETFLQNADPIVTGIMDQHTGNSLAAQQLHFPEEVVEGIPSATLPQSLNSNGIGA